WSNLLITSYCPLDYWHKQRCLGSFGLRDYQDRSWFQSLRSQHCGLGHLGYVWDYTGWFGLIDPLYLIIKLNND
ncbi:hypothetical protein, partial [Klebsiella pneumoniae]|uniref:hypothetical protein n=1 Tax=Klebsiella pneumoniae TaxID=573 RepID=UPI0025A20C76